MNTFHYIVIVALFAILGAVMAPKANAAVLCQSTRDPEFRAWFEGYSCPPGYYMIRTR